MTDIERYCNGITDPVLQEMIIRRLKGGLVTSEEAQDV